MIVQLQHVLCRSGWGWKRVNGGERSAFIVVKDTKTAGRRNIMHGKNGCVVCCKNPCTKTVTK